MQAAGSAASAGAEPSAIGLGCDRAWKVDPGRDGPADHPPTVAPCIPMWRPPCRERGPTEAGRRSRSEGPSRPEGSARGDGLSSASEGKEAAWKGISFPSSGSNNATLNSATGQLPVTRSDSERRGGRPQRVVEAAVASPPQAKPLPNAPETSASVSTRARHWSRRRALPIPQAGRRRLPTGDDPPGALSHGFGRCLPLGARRAPLRTLGLLGIGLGLSVPAGAVTILALCSDRGPAWAAQGQVPLGTSSRTQRCSAVP